MRRIFPVIGLLLLCSPCWAAFRAAGTATSGALASTTVTPGSPAGLAANDIIIVVVTGDAAANTYTFASGFTALYSSVSIGTPDGQTMAVGWKLAVGGDTLTVSRSSSGNSWIARAFCWSGRHTVNPPVASTLATNGSSNTSPTTLTANGVTAVASDDLLWVGVLDNSSANAGSTFTQPTGYTSQGVSIDTTDTFDTFAVATKDNVSAGATGTVAGSLTHSNQAGWFAGLIRIPVSGGVVASSGFNKRRKIEQLEQQ